MAINIKCHGTYYFKSEKDKGIREFRETVKAPSMQFFNETFTKLTGTDDKGNLTFRDTTFPNVRGRLKKKLLPVILSNKNSQYPNFVRIRGVVIDEIIAEGKEKLDLPINLMSVAQLTDLIRDRRMPIDASSYIDVDELRTDVMEFQEDPEMFIKNRARKDQRRADEKEFLALNNLLPDQAQEPKKKGVVNLE